MMPAAGDAPPLTASELVLAEEVLNLHSLYRASHNARPPPPLLPRQTSTHENKKKTKKKKSKGATRNPGSASNKEWPVNPSADDGGEAGVCSSWPDLTPPSKKAHTITSVLLSAQRPAISAARDHFLNTAGDADGSDDDDDEELDEDEAAAVESDAYEFFVTMFVKDHPLRNYYQTYWENGNFYCLACYGSKKMKGIGRTFGGLVSLVQHAGSGSRFSSLKMRAAHRAFVKAVCRVVGWDETRLPSIVLARGEPLLRSSANKDHTGVIEGAGHLHGSGTDVQIHEEDVGKENGTEINSSMRKLPEEDVDEGNKCDLKC